MKKLIQTGYIALFGAVAAFALTGCATSKSTKTALVCPQCKMVTVTRTVTVFPEGEGNFPPEDQEMTEMQHSCPGCQGAIVTLFKEGKFHHKCSICEQEAFTCPISHR